MYKRIKRLIAFLGLICMVMGMSVDAFAAGTVTYDGEATRFIFEPGSQYSPTDLFADFKGVMPGDQITQTVQIRNDVSNEVKIKLYMRSLGAHGDSQDFLSQLHLQVSQQGESNLFDAPADQSAQLTEWVYLGTFYSGAVIDLNITLEVPVELGNEYQDAIGYLDWQFKIEEFPVEPEDPKPPETGDSSAASFYIVLAGMSGLVVIFLVMYKRRSWCI